jgi:hypothetical protein
MIATDAAQDDYPQLIVIRIHMELRMANKAHLR